MSQDVADEVKTPRDENVDARRRDVPRALANQRERLTYARNDDASGIIGDSVALRLLEDSIPRSRAFFLPFRRLGVAALVESTRRAIRRAKNSSFQRRVRRRQNIRHGLEELIRVTVFHTIEEHDVSIHGRHRVRAVGEPLGAVTHRLDGVRAVQIKR